MHRTNFSAMLRYAYEKVISLKYWPWNHYRPPMHVNVHTRDVREREGNMIFFIVLQPKEEPEGQ